ncbi:MAG: hypothetical protein WCL39_03510 [Armatimonadota bacterium]
MRAACLPKFCRSLGAKRQGMFIATLLYTAMFTLAAQAVPLYYTSFEENGSPSWVQRITVTNGGSGYTTPPLISINGGRGSGANASVTITDGKITNVNLINPGSGYAAGGRVSFIGGNGQGAGGNYDVNNGGVSAVHSQNLTGGCGYTSQPQVVFAEGGSPASAVAEVSNGRVIAINIVNRGDGYTSAPSIVISGGNGSGATASAELEGSGLSGISVDPGGSGYTSIPTIQIVGNGSGGQAVATIGGGSIKSITIINAGKYITPPTVTAVGGGGSGAVLKASLGTVTLGTEWVLPPRYPWAQNSNDPMSYSNNGRTGNHSLYQSETFSQWSYMHEIGYNLGQDPSQNFYVKAWINFGKERERLINPGVPPCTCAPAVGTDWTNGVIAKGTITGASDGGEVVNYPNWNDPCRLTKPSISDANIWYDNLKWNSSMPTYVVTMLTGAATGKQWLIELPNYYLCGNPASYGYVPDGFCAWNYNHQLQVSPKAPNTQNPVTAGVQPGDQYQITGAIGPLYRAVQMWLDNSNQPAGYPEDFAKFGIWHRYTGTSACPGGVPNGICSDSNNWKYMVRETGTTPNDFFANPWYDTGIHRGFNFTGWHSYEIRVYGDNADPAKNRKFHFLVDGTLIATGSRYNNNGDLIPLNRLEIGGLAVSQESTQWDDVEIGLLPESGTVQQLSSVSGLLDVAEGTWVSLPETVIDASGPGWYHIQGPGRTGGIRGIYTQGNSAQLKPGDKIVPTGQVVMNGCEKVLNAFNPHLVSRGNSYEPPIWATHKSIKVSAPTLIGISVATWGDVILDEQGLIPGQFMISDHSSDPDVPIKVYMADTQGLLLPYQYVTVRGILGCENGMPVIYLGDDSQIVVEQ